MIGSTFRALASRQNLNRSYRRAELRDKSVDSLQDFLIDVVLGFAAEVFLSNDQRMIAPFDYVQKIRRGHLVADRVEQIERTKRIAGALTEKYWRSQIQQDLIAQFCSIAHGAKRISQTNHAGDLFLERNVTPDSAAHALAD